ncbi:hypothetical protein B0H17DRAFT_1247011 [Mycena rosella]|uniref:NADH:flavin oxidoreductase/NADH oxidase N-terminal domain-containing protein n=1 Tax=Mycena rosella TaxID=1033263 RepID=A0AAD7CY02_MYCRO|nr:hypothetical protein B0H17DRAFT_1247011 [Mycena rosella]
MSVLFTPLTLGSTTIQNRIGMVALTRNRTTDSIPNEVMLEYYVQRAVGGAGIIVTEGTLITRYGYVDNVPGIYNKEQVAGWKKITDAVHEAGSKMYCQRLLAGRTSHPDAPQQIKAGEPVYGPSAIPARGGKFRFIAGEPGYVTPTEVPDPTVIVDQFKAAAANAKEAGFDGVELHGTNGFLVEQFLDSTANKQTDKWGGSPKNRARFALEVLKAFIEVWGPNAALKISPSGGPNDVGMPLPETIETFGYLLREVDKLGLAYVTLMRYSAMLDPEYDGKKRGTPHDVLETFAPCLPTTPIFVNSGVTPAEAEELVGGGVVSGVFIGLSWITHPDLGKRIQARKPLDNVPDFAHLYGADGVDPALGYLDYKASVY